MFRASYIVYHVKRLLNDQRPFAGGMTDGSARFQASTCILWSSKVSQKWVWNTTFGNETMETVTGISPVITCILTTWKLWFKLPGSMQHYKGSDRGASSFLLCYGSWLWVLRLEMLVGVYIYRSVLDTVRRAYTTFPSSSHQSHEAHSSKLLQSFTYYSLLSFLEHTTETTPRSILQWYSLA